ncbi:PKD domain-containing protein [Spirosoma sp. BT702]|uniref:PKD domain-containing protein n=1 Tax=Spirosoma profusum TaxID=2771354 RepID=A0A927AUV1_9BACT|nr:PKD domain-containing protein [Spirosoma profusum]MBD2704831.1 PKD domain-containing protein [Spirosoma profusum]
MRLTFFFLTVIILTLQSCKKTEADVDLVPKGSALFSYQVTPEGDGKVVFMADSSQKVREFIWDFGDGTTASVVTAKTTHIFKKNKLFQVRLVAKNNASQLTDTKTIDVTTRFARTFEDLPASQRDTIRVLYVITSFDKRSGYRDIAENPNQPIYNAYLNQVFIKFLERRIPNHPKELDNLVFKGIPYVLSPEDTLKFYNNGDSDSYSKALFKDPQDALYQKILAKKRQVGASRLFFCMLDPGKPGLDHYQNTFDYVGYAPIGGGYVAAFTIPVIVHEMGHSLGFAHDNERDSRRMPLMNAGTTLVFGNEPAIWSSLRELQYKDYEHQLVKIKLLPPLSGEEVVPWYWRPILYPNNTVLDIITLKDRATTPFYGSDSNLVTTLSQALIDQYNIKVSPNICTSITVNAQPQPNGRIGVSSEKLPVAFCK